MTSETPALKRKPTLTFWQIWNMSFGFLGIQFGFGLQNANTSRIFETLGANVEQIPILWIAAPLTGLIIQPIIGYFSDRTWHPRLGRRRPYFLVGAILASIALCLMPNSPTLWVAAGMLWIMDASINISMEPFRAFVGDNLPSAQRTMGFAMQSFFIGTGAVVASALPWMMTNWLGISNVAPEGEISDSVKWSFYLGGIVFFLTVLWTVIRSKEYPPEELHQFEDNVADEIEVEELTREEYEYGGKRLVQVGGISALLGALIIFLLFRAGLNKELYILAFAIFVVGILWVAAGSMKQSGQYRNGFVAIMSDLLQMPRTMQQLALVQFFSWFALFSMWIYTTAGVTKHLYGTTDPTSALYNEGADWVGFCFAVYNGVAALVAFTLPVLAKYTSRRVTHLICLILGGLGLISVYFIHDPMLLLVSMVGVGIAWASILSMPYAMLAGALPSNKMGYYMGVFNFFIVIPQIVAATILGFIVGFFFKGEAIYALVVGGVGMILAGLLCLLVEDEG
ncbi:MAG: MFS transporter [Lewinellaceae bacterium]|nr:MFS transporter [Lewinellaceae bacterium]